MRLPSSARNAKQKRPASRNPGSRQQCASCSPPTKSARSPTAPGPENGQDWSEERSHDLHYSLRWYLHYYRTATALLLLCTPPLYPPAGSAACTACALLRLAGRTARP